MPVHMLSLDHKSHVSPDSNNLDVWIEMVPLTMQPASCDANADFNGVK